MRAVLVTEFGGTPVLADVEDPAPAPHGVVVAVEATGVCRSDWHAWQGHDDDVRLPHVPGHELAGTVVATVVSVPWRDRARKASAWVGPARPAPASPSRTWVETEASASPRRSRDVTARTPREESGTATTVQ